MTEEARETDREVMREGECHVECGEREVGSRERVWR